MAKQQISGNKYKVNRKSNIRIKKGCFKKLYDRLYSFKWQTPVFLLVILVLIMIFFNSGLFGGKVFSSADNIASGSFKHSLMMQKQKGNFLSGFLIYSTECQALRRLFPILKECMIFLTLYG